MPNPKPVVGRAGLSNNFPNRICLVFKGSTSFIVYSLSLNVIIMPPFSFSILFLSIFFSFFAAFFFLRSSFRRLFSSLSFSIAAMSSGRSVISFMTRFLLPPPSSPSSSFDFVFFSLPQPHWPSRPSRHFPPYPPPSPSPPSPSPPSPSPPSPSPP